MVTYSLLLLELWQILLFHKPNVGNGVVLKFILIF